MSISLVENASIQMLRGRYLESEANCHTILGWKLMARGRRTLKPEPIEPIVGFTSKGNPKTGGFLVSLYNPNMKKRPSKRIVSHGQNYLFPFKDMGELASALKCCGEFPYSESPVSLPNDQSIFMSNSQPH